MIVLDDVALAATSMHEFGHELVKRLRVLGARRAAINVLDEERQVLQFLPGGFEADEDVTASYQVHVDEPDEQLGAGVHDR